MEGEHRFLALETLNQASVLRGVFQQREQCKAEVPRTCVTHFGDVLTVEQFTQVGCIFLAHVVY